MRQKQSCGWGGKIRPYLIEEFELEGFKKEVGDCYNGWTKISLTMIEKIIKKGVDRTPFLMPGRRHFSTLKH